MPEGVHAVPATSFRSFTHQAIGNKGPQNHQNADGLERDEHGFHVGPPNKRISRGTAYPAEIAHPF